MEICFVRFRNAAILFGAGLLLNSCQPPPYEIIAQLENGNVVLHARYSGLIFGKPFGWDDHRLTFVQLSISKDDKIVWQIEAIRGKTPNCPIDLSFPVIYGKQRCDYRTTVQPENLVKNGVYTIIADAEMRENGEGSFAITSTGGIRVLRM